jgi:hypothetical protein
MKNKKLISSGIFLLLAIYGIAQQNLPRPDPTPPNPNMPIDGGLVFLIVVAVVFGVRKLRR